MNCLTMAIAKAEKNQPKPTGSYQAQYRAAVRNSEKQKLTSLFERRMSEAGFEFTNLTKRHAETVRVIFREWKFWEGRKFAFDYAWPLLRLAVEIEGGVWRKGGGAHSHPTAIMRDMEKYNAAAVLGWRILRFNDFHLKSPYCVESVLAALKGGKPMSDPIQPQMPLPSPGVPPANR